MRACYMHTLNLCLCVSGCLVMYMQYTNKRTHSVCNVEVRRSTVRPGGGSAEAQHQLLTAAVPLFTAFSNSLHHSLFSPPNHCRTQAEVELIALGDRPERSGPRAANETLPYAGNVCMFSCVSVCVWSGSGAHFVWVSY